MPINIPIIPWRYPRAVSILALLALLWACGSSDSDSSSPGANGKTISGAVSIRGTVLTDSDVNDTNAPYVTNDSAVTAQAIPNPALVGGYVNLPGAGAQGRSSTLGDTEDYFKTTLLSGQAVRLQIGNPGDNTAELNDLQLTLINAQGEEFSSTGANGTKIVTALAAGEYFIKVSALTGASNYLLNISLDAFQTGETAIPTPYPNIGDLFVPGEVIVKFKNTQRLVSVGKAGDVLHMKAGGHGRNSLYEIRETVPSKHSLDKHARDERLKKKTFDIIETLRQRADVESARLNYIRRASRIPNDPYYLYQWHYPLINLPQAWDITTGNGTDGNDVIVAVIDTGILPGHPDLQGQTVAGYDFIRNITNAGDGNGIDDNPYDEGDGGHYGPSSFHGTHVAGTVAAASNNQLGVAGIAWGAKVMPLRVLGSEGGTDYDIEQAVRFAAGLENDSGVTPPQRADVINLSLGGSIASTIPPEAFTLARQAGVIIVAAAGNQGSNQLSYPASLDGVVSVGAVAMDQTIAAYSNYGNTMDLVAPGGNSATDLNGDGYADGVLSTLAMEDRSLEYVYAFYQGTSMAAPHVAGVVALMKSVYRELSPQQFDQWLAAGLLTQDLGTEGRDNYYGHGFIDAYRAVGIASQAANNILVEPEPLLTTSKTLLNFSDDLSEITFSLANNGGGTLTIQGITVNAPDWLTVTPVTVDSSGLGDYRVIIERALLPQNTPVITAALTIESSAGDLTVPVLVLSAAQYPPNDAGVHYILLIDIDSGQSVKQVSSTAVDGVYTFAMENVPFGNYILVAGANPDNNGYLCEAAEACGEYPSIGLLQPITIEASSPAVAVLNFETGFNQIAISRAQPINYLP